MRWVGPQCSGTAQQLQCNPAINRLAARQSQYTRQLKTASEHTHSLAYYHTAITYVKLENISSLYKVTACTYYETCQAGKLQKLKIVSYIAS
jgi:hypothetical protein